MLSDRLKLLLSELGMNQTQFARRLRLNDSHFSKIFRGLVKPSNKLLLLIETTFSVNPSWLEHGEGEMFSSQGFSIEKRDVLDIIDTLSISQLKVVLSFLQYFKDIK